MCDTRRWGGRLRDLNRRNWWVPPFNLCILSLLLLCDGAIGLPV